MSPVEMQKLANRWAASIGAPRIAEDGIIGPKSKALFAALDSAKVNWQTPPQFRYFVDSCAAVTQQRIDFLRKTVGCLPIAWGRYLSLGSTKQEELDLLNANGIRWLPIPNHVSRVVLGTAEGYSDAQRDIKEMSFLIANRNCLVTDRVFLDVEHLPTVSPEYYSGYSRAWSEYGKTPSIYMPWQRAWPAQWVALQRAIESGASCGGAWVSYYPGQTNKSLADGSDSFESIDWDSKIEGDPSVTQTIAWQYRGNCHGRQFDFSIINPAFAGQL